MSSFHAQDQQNIRESHNAQNQQRKFVKFAGLLFDLKMSRFMKGLFSPGQVYIALVKERRDAALLQA